MKNKGAFSDSVSGIIEHTIAMAIAGTIGAFVVESGQSAINAVFARCLIGSVIIALYVYFKKSFRGMEFGKDNYIFIFMVSVCIVLNWVLLFKSYRYAPIGIVTVIYHMGPIFAFIVGTIFYSERISLARLLLLLLAFCGVILIGRAGDTENPDFAQGAIFGYILAFGAAVFYAFVVLFAKRLRGVPAPITTLSQLLIGVLMLAPVVNYDALPTSTKQWTCLVVLGVVHSAIMYLLIYSAYRKMSISLISVLSYVYPLAALFVDLIYFHRKISVFEIIGALCILFSSVAITLLRNKPSAV